LITFYRIYHKNKKKKNYNKNYNNKSLKMPAVLSKFYVEEWRKFRDIFYENNIYTNGVTPKDEDFKHWFHIHNRDFHNGVFEKLERNGNTFIK